MSADKDEGSTAEKDSPLKKGLSGAKRLIRSWHLALEWLFAAVFVLLVVVTGYAAFENVRTRGWTSDAAAWVQACGSIIAIVGAAWLSRGEIRQARRWRRQLGEEAAWSVRFVIAQAQFDTQVIAAELTNPEKKIDAATIRSWKQRASLTSQTLQATLSRTDQIHPATIVSAANAKVLIDSLLEDLARYGDEVAAGKKPDDDLVGDIVYVHVNLIALIENVDARYRGLQEALDEGNDMLPIQEWAKRRRV